MGATRRIAADSPRTTTDPGDEIVSAARSLDADVVVVGRGRGNLLRRLMLGSVSAKVVRNAPCDVLVVHRDASRFRRKPRRFGVVLPMFPSGYGETMAT
jgi:hypothetical protein